MTYQGSCHCGGIAFEVEGDLTGAVACNCSMCSRKGSLLWFVPRDQFHLRTSTEQTGEYRFNRQVIQHRFCRNCGLHPYAVGVDRNGNEMAAINIRCLEGVDLDAIPVQHVDGRSF